MTTIVDARPITKFDGGLRFLEADHDEFSWLRLWRQKHLQNETNLEVSLHIKVPRSHFIKMQAYTSSFSYGACCRSDDVIWDDDAVLLLRKVPDEVRGSPRSRCHGSSILRSPGDWSLSAPGLRHRVTEERLEILRLFGGCSSPRRPQV